MLPRLAVLRQPLKYKSEYHKDIDGLRAIAVICVIINHFNHAALPGGYLGVDVFFVVSGYVITASLEKRRMPLWAPSCCTSIRGG
jgi:peptidoglycan/LPS O-acetylase OafA/YrhL